jgi:ribonuclease HII
MIGIDKAGRGPVLGPLIVAAIKVHDDGPLIEMGVKDSKKLTPKNRERLYQSIKTCCEVSIVGIEAGDIDSLRPRTNLNQIERELFIRALSGLEHRGERVYLDCFDVNEERLCQDITSTFHGIEVISRHRADETYPCVAAASIAAKVHRDTAISHLEALAQERWGISIGSGYPSDPITCRFLEHIDDSGEAMPFFVRRSWKTIGRYKQLTLDI